MYALIYNPVAGNGKARKIYQKIYESTLLKGKTTYFETKSKGHIQSIVAEIEQSSKPYQLIFVIGGDGTIHEVVNALANKGTKLAYIPGGSGNDFARGINNLASAEEIVQRAILDKKKARYWLCAYDTEERVNQSFLNSFGVGFDAVVVNGASKLAFRDFLSKFHLDSFIYLIALLKELFAYKPIPLSIDLDGKSYEFDRVLFLTVNNQPFMGGGMKINPFAINNESEFSIIVVDSVPKWKVLLLFSTVFFGKHIHFKGVHLLKGQQIRILSTDTMPYQVDGEYGETHRVEIRKLPDPIYIKGVS